MTYLEARVARPSLQISEFRACQWHWAIIQIHAMFQALVTRINMALSVEEKEPTDWRALGDSSCFPPSSA